MSLPNRHPHPFVEPAALLVRALAIVLALAGCARGGTAQATTTTAINADDLRKRVYIFADDSMQGRRAGTPGHVRAISYIVRELSRIGLKPAGDKGGYYQRVPILVGPRDTLWSSNVVAVLEGSDPALRAEYVAIGAHSDHIGIRRSPVDHDLVRAIQRAEWEKRGRVAGAPPLTRMESDAIGAEVRRTRAARMGGAKPRLDSINNGADDDGSGSMAMLELAEYFSAAAARPKRSVIFVWHTGEEIELNGSEWFVTHPAVPLEKIVAQINIDMIGRGSARDIRGGGDDYLSVIGARRLSTTFGAWVDSVNAAAPRPLALDYSLDADGHPENIYCRSDHWMYASRGIPIVFLFTNLHEDYHEVTDEPAYLDYPHYARVVNYVAALVRKTGDAPVRPAVDKPKPDPRAPCSQ
jgi:hypothetical protein